METKWRAHPGQITASHTDLEALIDACTQAISVSQARPSVTS